MNYRHAFHAGNHADVLKHLALVFCLEALRRKAAPFGVLDTHAGAGQYDLFGAEAARSPEWRDGVAKLADWTDAPAPIAMYLAALKRHDATGRYYPGSPALIAQALRPQDRLAACELHPEEVAALKRTALPGRVELHQRDGWEALKALLPLTERRGLVLIDPPYENPDELFTATQAIKAAAARFSHGIYLWWRPLKDSSALDQADAEFSQPSLRADLWIDTPALTGKLVGSSLLLINPPYGLAEALREALPALALRLAAGAAGWRLDPKA